MEEGWDKLDSRALVSKVLRPWRWWGLAGLVIVQRAMSREGLGGHVQCIYVRLPDRGHWYLYNLAWVFM